MTTPTTPKPKKARKKAFANEIARKTHNNNRRTLAREAAKRAEREEATARRNLSSGDRKMRVKEVNRRTAMVSSGLTPRLQAVMTSWGINVPVSIQPAAEISAHTDFQSVTVRHDRRLRTTFTETEEGEKVVEPIDLAELRAITAETRGLFYHEVGHLLFTVNLPRLLTLSKDEGHVPANPAMARPASAAQDAYGNPVDDSNQWVIDYVFHNAWNILEDQRMEMALVEESPQLAAYLTVLISRVMVRASGPDLWALVAGREYLPDSIRSKARQLWDDTEHAQTSAEILAMVEAYATADTASEMIQAVEGWVSSMNPTTLPRVDDHSNMHKMRGHATRQDPLTDEEKEALKEKVAEAGQKAEDAIDKAQDQAEAKGNDHSKEGSKSESKDSDAIPGSGAGQDDSNPQDEADEEETPYARARREEKERQAAREEEARDAVEALADDETLNEDIAAINDAYAADAGALTKWAGVHANLDPLAINKAHMLADELEAAFRAATEDTAPHWETGQRRGILDPIRYATRAPGDLEIFRNYADEGEPGSDLAVSLFLDVSGSMSSSGEELGIAAWATKKACDALGIECDVTLFSNGGFTLWGPDETPAYVPTIVPDGGTNPKDAFEAMLSEERSKRRHIVLIMTDGDWVSNDALKPFRLPNATTVALYYRASSSKEAMSIAPDLAARLHTDEGYNTGDLANIPRIVENILLSLV